jgi:aryl sulfotransferase
MPELMRAAAQVVRTPVMDSRRWNAFEPRDGDIVIGTFAKCGTTWTQRIVDLLVFQSPEVRPFGEISPWLDATFFNTLEDDLAALKAQTHRRYIKSHLPFDALPIWDTVKYIHVGRDGRDARLSWKNHEEGFTPEIMAKIGANAVALARERGEALTGPPPPAPKDDRAYLLRWLDELEARLDGAGGAGANMGMGYFDFETSYWRERKRPNVLLVYYNDLKEDLEGEMQRIAGFLEIETPKTVMPSLVEAARFETMKKDGDALFPRLHELFDRGADRFINQGKSGRWRQYLNADEVARYEKIVRRSTTPGLARWLDGGRRSAGEPRSSAD